MASRVFTRFFYDLTYWPPFWSSMTHILTWPRNCHNDHSEQVWWWLDEHCGLYSVHKVFQWFDLLIYFLTQHDPYSKLIQILSWWSFWARLSMIGPKLWPLVFTRFFYDLTYWPTFRPDMTHMQTWPRYCHDDDSEQVWWWLDHNCGL